MVAVPRFGVGDATTATAASSNNLPVAKPANVADGDLLVAVVYSQFTGTVTATPAGWNLIAGFPSKSGGVYYKPIPTASAETATSYAWTMSGYGRMCLTLLRVTGANLSAPIDSVGATATQVTTGSFTMPAATPAGLNDLLLTVGYWNNSSTAVSTMSPDPLLTDGLQISSPATGNTSGTDVAYQQLTAAGSTGTRTYGTAPSAASAAGVMFTISPTPSLVLTGTGTLTATGAASFTGSLALTGSGTLMGASGYNFTGTANLTGTGALTGTGNPVGKVNLTGSGTLTAHATAPLDTWLANTPLYVAHRGGSADWVEESLYAYSQAATWSNTVGLEVSVWQTSDGVWVCSHDQTTARMFGTSYDIPTNTWATLSTLRTLTGNQPLARLTDVLNAYATGNRVLFIDNKGQQNMSALLDLLDTYGGNGRFVAKGFCTSTAWADAAAARGYKGWGYYYDADVATNLPTTQSHWTLLGMDVGATAADWTAVQSYGKPVLAHILSTAAQKTTATGYGATGYMASGVQEVVPQTPATLTLTGTGQLTTTATAGTTAAATFTCTGLLTLAGAVTGMAVDITITATLAARMNTGTLDTREWGAHLE